MLSRGRITRLLSVGPLAVAGFFALSVGAATQSRSEIERRDFFVDSDPGVRVFVREVTVPHGADKSAGKPILLVHGARVPGLASFDLPVSGGSLAADLAQMGFDVFVMDVRGYGKSTRPKEMDEPPSAHAPLARSNEATRDISAVVDSIRQQRHVSAVALFGWATGGQWAGYYASIYPRSVLEHYAKLYHITAAQRRAAYACLRGKSVDS